MATSGPFGLSPHPPFPQALDPRAKYLPPSAGAWVVRVLVGELKPGARTVQAHVSEPALSDWWTHLTSIAHIANIFALHMPKRSRC